jgi:hypothetical protein
MTIYNDLNLIDDFEQRHGFEDTLRRARQFMVAYLDLMVKHLPEPTKRSVDAAKRHLEGTADSRDLDTERKSIWLWLRQRNAAADYVTPENAIVHAAFGPLTEQTDLKPAELISERVSDFLSCANAFEDHSDAVAGLLRSFFPE